MSQGSLLHEIKHVVCRLREHSWRDKVLGGVPRRMQGFQEMEDLDNDIKNKIYKMI